MKKILVMSDTHGNKGNIAKALAKFGDVDYIIHLGDYVRDAEYIKKLTAIKVFAVKGNCDISTTAKTEITINVEDKKILAVHGHQQSVKMSILRLGLYGLEKGADIVLFGHTHETTEHFFENIMLYNPGSLGEPRGRKPSVGIIKIDNGAFKISTCKL
ncbi:MAG: metallophosphoesterase [Christensenellales bacterium]|jgi:putative phosphoesterase